MAMSRMKLDVSERISAHGVGGLGLIHQMVQRIGLPSAIDSKLKLLKIHRPYHESDHVLAIAYNTLAGGASLEATPYAILCNRTCRSPYFGIARRTLCRVRDPRAAELGLRTPLPPELSGLSRFRAANRMVRPLG